MNNILIQLKVSFSSHLYFVVLAVRPMIAKAEGCHVPPVYET